MSFVLVSITSTSFVILAALLVVDDFRLFCGDLGNEVTDDTLARAFNKYPSFQKAKVIRDKRSNKTKGFGFVSFKDPNDFTRAMREMNGKLCYKLSLLNKHQHLSKPAEFTVMSE